jgi:hypothetical protein
VALNEKWDVKEWSGSLQLQREETVPKAGIIDLSTYLRTEELRQKERTRAAENLIVSANTALAQGDPQQARRAFQAAYGLSTHDAAFNEDARVQLHNIKLQQALVGLNVRQAGAAEGGVLAGRLQELRTRREVAYTQQEAKDLIDRNTVEDNTAFMRLAERLIQQQDAAVNKPAAIRANLPDQGRVLTFKRAVLVDPWADLKLNLEATAARSASWGVRILILGGTLFFIVIIAMAVRSIRPKTA